MKALVKKISGNIVDVLNKEIYSGTLVIEGSKITDIIRDYDGYDTFIIPVAYLFRA